MPRSRRTRAEALRIRGRWWLRRLDRETPEWMRWLTPWGSSLVLHAVLLLMLALFLYATQDRSGTNLIDARLSEQLIDDLTTLKDDDEAGDPFTTLDEITPPSLVLDTSQLDPERINLPELPPEILLGPELQLSALTQTAPAPMAPGSGPPRVKLGSPGELTAPFSGRQGEAKARLVRREGGSVESEKAVELGLDWLSRHQRSDGGWSLDVSSECEGLGCPKSPAMQADVAATGLALLPMLGAGLTHTEPNRYQDQMKRGLDWLVEHQGPDGALIDNAGGNTRLYTHAIGTMTLCEAYGLTRDPKLREPAEKAIAFIVQSQSPQDGGWRYEPKQPGDTSVFGWQLFALRSAHLAGLDVPEPTTRGAWLYLNAAATDPDGTTYAYMPGHAPNPVMTAEALLMRQYLGWPAGHPSLIRGAGNVADDLLKVRERNIYYWYYGTQLLHNLQGPAWQAWNLKVRDGLVSLQIKDRGCDWGSWDPMSPVPDRWGRTSGRLFVTSLSLLTLEVYYRYLPLYRSGGDNPFERASNPGNGARPATRAEAAGR